MSLCASMDRTIGAEFERAPPSLATVAGPAAVR